MTLYRKNTEAEYDTTSTKGYYIYFFHFIAAFGIIIQ